MSDIHENEPASIASRFRFLLQRMVQIVGADSVNWRDREEAGECVTGELENIANVCTLA